MGCQSSKQKVRVLKPNLFGDDMAAAYAANRFQNKYNADWTQDHSKTQ